jgi:inorganic pyrophosphatase
MAIQDGATLEGIIAKRRDMSYRFGQRDVHPTTLFGDPHLLSSLPAYSEDGAVYAVVEAPKGSLVKLEYEIKLGAFTVAHSLPLGLSYPFDWGFVPSTQAADGDPLDILILHEASTYPGVVLPCRPLGVVETDQEEKDSKRERNDRVIVMPAWHDRVGEFEHPSDLPSRLKEEIEQFFLSTTFFTAKKPAILGWRGPKKASCLIKETNKSYLLQDI